MSIERVNVLVVSGGSLQGLTIVKGLAQSPHVRTVLADAFVENITRYWADRFYPVPLIREHQSFVNALLAICVRERIHLILPATDLELELLSENRALFATQNIQVAVSDLPLLKTLRDKKKTTEFLLAQEIATLPSLDIESAELSFPIIGKPRHGWGGKGVVEFHSAEQLREQWRGELATEYVWQPLWSNFQEYSIDFAIQASGSVSPLVIRKRVKTLSGFAVICESANHEGIAVQVGKLANVLAQNGGRGLLNVQVLERDSEIVISDLNPRVGTSAVFGYGIGINLPLFLCAEINPAIAVPVVPQTSTQVPVKMIRYLNELWIEKLDLGGVRGVVFDLDDTLIHQKRWILDKCQLLVEQNLLLMPIKSAFLASALRLVEEGHRADLFDRLADHFGWSPEFKQQLIEAYRNIIPADAARYSDVLDTLERIRQLGFKLAILTDNPPVSQRQKLDACGLTDQFDSIVFSRELGVEKPDPAPFLKIAEELGLTPETLVMVGDNLYRDIAGAHSAGYKHSFLIERRGGFFNFDCDSFDRIRERAYSFTPIPNVSSLLWYLDQRMIAPDALPYEPVC